MMKAGEACTTHFLVKAGSLLFRTAVLSAVTVGCSTVFLQNDGFKSKLAAGCPTEDRCEALVEEATKRLDGCRDNTIGYVRCDDARADLQKADALFAAATGTPRANKGKRLAAAPPSVQQAPNDAAVASSPAPAPQIDEQLEADRQAAQRAVVEGTETELKTGRCTPANVATLRRALGFAKQGASSNFCLHRPSPDRRHETRKRTLN